MIANWITLSRLPLLALIIVLLYTEDATLQFVAAGLIIVLIAMDSLDGMIARSRGEVTMIGSILDIAADRTVEWVMWVVFAHLRIIPIVIPLVVMTRGVFVDAIRSVAPARGLKPFELMRSPVGRFLVGSPWLRSPYAVLKAVAFFLLAFSLGLASAGLSVTWVNVLTQLSVWGAFAFCLVRGLPVLIEAPGTLRENR